MSTLVCLGLGYCAQHYVSEFGSRFDRVVGTTRNADRAAALGRERLGGKSVEMLVFDGASPSNELKAAISEADALLVSAAPVEGRDPVLALLEEDMLRAPRLKSAVYLSSLGVYGIAAVRGSTRLRRPFRRSRAAVAPASRPNSIGRRSGRDATFQSRSCGSAASMVRDATEWCASCAVPCIVSPSPATSRIASTSTTLRRRSMRLSRAAPWVCSTLSMTSQHRRAIRSHLRRA